jgi:hypothetical protein
VLAPPAAVGHVIRDHHQGEEAPSLVDQGRRATKPHADPQLLTIPLSATHTWVAGGAPRGHRHPCCQRAAQLLEHPRDTGDLRASDPPMHGDAAEPVAARVFQR